MFARAAFRMSHKSLVPRILILTFLLFSWIFVGTQISRFPDPIYRFQIFQKSGLGQKLKPGMGPSLGPSAINCIVCKLGLMIVLDINLYMETEAAISGSPIVINFAHASFMFLIYIYIPAQASSLVYEAPALGLEAPARETNDPQQKTENIADEP